MITHYQQSISFFFYDYAPISGPLPSQKTRQTRSSWKWESQYLEIKEFNSQLPIPPSLSLSLLLQWFRAIYEKLKNGCKQPIGWYSLVAKETKVMLKMYLRSNGKLLLTGLRFHFRFPNKQQAYVSLPRRFSITEIDCFVKINLRSFKFIAEYLCHFFLSS